MHCPTRPFRPLAVLLSVSIGAAGPAFCQVPNKGKPTRAAIVGRVVDSTNAPIEGAEVAAALIVSRDSVIVHKVTSDRRGNAVLDVPAGGPYTLVSRKIGFGSAKGTDIHFKGGDTLRVDFELPAVGVTLPTITTTSRRGARFAIASDEIEPKKFPNALELVASKRPYMLGDPDQCSPPLPPPWPVPNNAGGMGRRPWLNGSRIYDVFNPPYSPYVQRVYVNGTRIDRPGESALIALHDVPSSQIAEMRYIDCNTTADRLWPYSIYVVLKAVSKEVQDSVLHAIARGTPAKP